MRGRFAVIIFVITYTVNIRLIIFCHVLCFSWSYLQCYLHKIGDEARELNKKSRPVNYRVHIGHGIYVSVTDRYLCVDLRHFYVPYGLSEDNAKPTKCGIALRLDERSALLDMLPILYAANPLLADTKPCCENSDHANQLGMLDCSACNPFSRARWN